MRRPIYLYAVGIVANGVLFLSVPLEVCSLAALIICGLVPGALLVEWLLVQSDAPPDPIEHVVYALGAGFALMVVGMLLLSYLPGKLERTQILLAANAFDWVMLLLLWLCSRRDSALFAARANLHSDPSRSSVSSVSSAWLLAGLVIVLVVAGFLRMGSLGYAEFLTDEARVVLRSAAVMQGYEDVLFIHRKGPAEILLPALIFSLTGQINEAVARLPFAVASLAALLAVFQLGRRTLGALAGWLAVFLLAFDGYLIGFAHFVQFQSFVVLSSVLVVLVLHRLERDQRAMTQYFSLTALFWATGLLSHYDALLVAPPATLLFGALLWRRPNLRGQVLRSAAPALLLGAGVLAVFYLPFVLHPHFQATLTYVVDRRLSGPGFPYNNLLDVLRRSSVYNSTYYVITLALLLLAALALSYWRGWPTRAGRILAVVAPLLIALTTLIALLRPDWLRSSGIDLTVVVFLLVLIPVWLLPRLALSWRMLWVWFTSALMIALFFVAFPRTHVYTFVAPSALLAGATLAEGWGWLATRVGRRSATLAGAMAVLVATLVFGLYAYLYFVYNQVEVLRTWPDHHPAFYWQPQDVSSVDAVYGFPLSNGWKTAGVLYQEGELTGSYESNQRDNLITYWYTRAADRCRSTANSYFVIDTVEPWARSPQATIDQLSADGFHRWGEAVLNGQPRLSIYRTGNATDDVRILPLADASAAFDALATPDLPLDYPVIEPEPANPLHVNFGNRIWLEGYELVQSDDLQPGDTLHLRLFWRAQQPLETSYKVFNQAYYGDGVMVAQKDGYPVCDRQPTTEWYPGEIIVDEQPIPVLDDAPAGIYPLVVGLYADDTMERLPVLDAAGNPVDDKVHIADIRISESGE